MKTSKRPLYLIDALVLILLFSGPALNSFLYLFGIPASSGQLAVIYLVVDILSISTYLIIIKKGIPKNFIYLFAFIILVLIGFLITYVRYEANNETFFSEFKLFIATVPAVLALSLMISDLRHYSVSTSLVWGINIILTIILAVLVRTNYISDSGALIHDESGFIYQNISYYAAYNVGLSLFLLTEDEYQKGYKRVVLFWLIIVQVSVCALSGGRGGMFLSVVLLLIFALKHLRKNLLLFIPIIIISLFFFLIIIPGLNVEPIARSFSVFSVGGYDDNRADLQLMALSHFIEKPFFGNGIGSVFYLLGSYSHNFITDILCETGIFGLLISIWIVFIFVKKVIKLYKEGSIFRFMIIIIICGIVLNSFSGYFWVNQFILLPLSIVFLSDH